MRRGAAPPPHLVDAAADMVAGAQAGLSRDRVKVIVDGMTRRLRNTEGQLLDGSEQFDLLQKHERHIEEKIAEQFVYIHGLIVSVGCDVERSQVHSKSVKYDKATSFEADQQIEEETEETTTASPAAQEPGLAPNTGTNLAMSLPVAGEGSTHTHQKSRINKQVLPGTQTEERTTPAGGGKAVSASVRVPRSYFVSVLKNGRLDAKEPDEQAIQALIDAELPKIREGVMRCAKLTDKADVSVEAYADVMPVMLAAAPESATASMSLMLGSHTKEIALGALAVVSLFMVSTMVRKGVPAPAVASAAAAGSSPFSVPGGPTVLNSGETLAGEVGSGDPLLDGMELDEDAARAQQMLDQVSTMVGDNPDGAAALVKRWLSRP
jgi:flagellar biosynthesis/type III secretory pathway M-ring protein FliF/YscJ